MRRFNIDDAAVLARRFLEAHNDLRKAEDAANEDLTQRIQAAPDDRSLYRDSCTRQTATLGRRSMDLTHALAKMRNDR